MNELKLTLQNAKRLKIDYEYLEKFPIKINGYRYSWSRLLVVPLNYKSKADFLNYCALEYYKNDNRAIFVDLNSEDYTVVIMAMDTSPIPTAPNNFIDFLEAVSQNGIPFIRDNYEK